MSWNFFNEINFFFINFFFIFYRKDSIVTEKINYDLLKKATEIQEGVRLCPELLGHCNISKTKDNIPLAIQKHLSNGCN